LKNSGYNENVNKLSLVIAFKIFSKELNFDLYPQLIDMAITNDML